MSTVPMFLVFVCFGICSSVLGDVKMLGESLVTKRKAKLIHEDECITDRILFPTHLISLSMMINFFSFA
jgi:hypothetical protein